MTRLIALCLALLLLAGGCGEEERRGSSSAPDDDAATSAIELPPSDNALDAFTTAMATCYLPAEHADGEEQKALARQAVAALAAIPDQYPEADPLILREADFYRGKCLLVLERPADAAIALYRSFERPAPHTPHDAHDEKMMTYRRMAALELLDLQKHLPDHQAVDFAQFINSPSADAPPTE